MDELEYLKQKIKIKKEKLQKRDNPLLQKIIHDYGLLEKRIHEKEEHVMEEKSKVKDQALFILESIHLPLKISESDRNKLEYEMLKLTDSISIKP